MTKHHSGKASLFGGHDEVSCNAPDLRTRMVDLVYADTIAVDDADFFDIEWGILVVVEQVPKLIDLLVLGRSCAATCSD